MEIPEFPECIKAIYCTWERSASPGFMPAHQGRQTHASDSVLEVAVAVCPHSFIEPTNSIPPVGMAIAINGCFKTW